MTSLSKKALVILLLLILFTHQVTRAEAAKGIPGSPAFGFGVSLYPNGPMLDQALKLLNDLRPDWLYVPVSWAAASPAADTQPDLAVLDQVMAAAAQWKIAVVLSVSDAPAWAQTPQGPDPRLAAQYAALLVQRYPGTLQALELFPRANTLTGWGSAPNPKSYLALYRAVQNGIAESGADLLLVAAGMQPLGPGQQDPAIAMDDLVFLQGLYDAGGKDMLKVISLQYTDMHADLLLSPLENKGMLFRHYETVRALMLANGHIDGFMWITGFGLPSGSHGQARVNAQDLDQQQEWLQQGYYQLLSQLYIGTAVMQSLNPPPTESAIRAASILQSDQSLHPFYQSLYRMTRANNEELSFQKPGRAKEGRLAKNR